MRNTLKRMVSVLLMTMLLLIHCPSAPAQSYELQTRNAVMRVAFPQAKGFTTTDENGVRHGIVVDFLREIAKYTGWTYEYIDTSGENMLTQFMNGEFDLTGGTYYSTQLDPYFAYPSYSTGSSRSVLLGRWDDASIHTANPKSMNGKVIGVYERATENIRRLEQFLATNDLKCTIRTFSHEEQVDGGLYEYLENGTVDLLLGNAADDTGLYRAVAYFDAQPHYIVTRPDRQDILADLNWALSMIFESDPSFADEVYQDNFPDVGISNYMLNQSEKNFVASAGEVSVAVVTSFHPFYCMDVEDGEHSGMVPDFLSHVEAFSGLHFTYLLADTYAHAITMVQKGEADMLGFYMGTEQDAVKAGLSLSAAYAELNDLVVRNKAVTYPSSGLTCALLEGREPPLELQAERFVYYPHSQDVINALLNGEADFVFGLSPQLETLLQNNLSRDLIPVSMANSANPITFALARPAQPELLSILNKAIHSMSNSDRTSLTQKNLISVGQAQYTVTDFIYANPFVAIGVVAAFLMLVVVITFIMSRSSVRSAKMRAEKEKAEADSRAKSAFLSRMSHEIRTPMNAIVGITDLMQLRPDAEKQKIYLDKLRSSSRYLLNLINDILETSRIDSGMMSIAAEAFSLSKVVDETQSMMRAEAQRHGLTLSVDAQIENSGLTGDPIRLKQVLINLLSNAIKFTSVGGNVRLEVKELAADDDGATFAFSVADTGIGIRKEDQERIFKAFEQVGTSYARSQGTGLGLPICRSIVSLMGGELKLESEPGKGSRFSFEITLPYGNPTTEPVYVKTENMLRNTRLLLAEDNEINAEIAIDLLSRQGAEITLARNGKEAVELFTQNSLYAFNAILMDLQMPEMDGLEATRAIRAMQRPDAATVPIIAMTANSFQEDKDAAIEAGMNDFITKPLDLDHLYTALLRHAKGATDA